MMGSHATTVTGKCPRQHEGRARPARSQRPRIRQKRVASCRCYLSLLRAFIRRGRYARLAATSFLDRPITLHDGIAGHQASRGLTS
jgi:hypothetical protein